MKSMASRADGHDRGTMVMRSERYGVRSGRYGVRSGRYVVRSGRYVVRSGMVGTAGVRDVVHSGLAMRAAVG